MDTVLLILALAGFLLLVMWMTRPKPPPPAPRRSPLIPAAQQLSDERAWEQRVLAQLKGDRAAMERLVAGRARRMPRASRKQLLELVYHDHVRDQR